MVAMVRYSSQAGCQAQHAIGSPTVCYLCLSRFLSSLYVSIPLFVRLSFAAFVVLAAPTFSFRPARVTLRFVAVTRNSRDGELDVFTRLDV